MLTTVLHICLHCFGTCGSICESSLFSFCSRTLDIRSDRLWQVRNIHVIPRILQALDVTTGQRTPRRVMQRNTVVFFFDRGHFCQDQWTYQI